MPDRFSFAIIDVPRENHARYYSHVDSSLDFTREAREKATVIDAMHKVAGPTATDRCISLAMNQHGGAL